MGKGTHLPQVALPEDRETHISVGYFDGIVTLYTNRASTMRRLEKKGIEYRTEDIYNGKVYSRTYELPLEKANVFFHYTIHS